MMSTCMDALDAAYIASLGNYYVVLLLISHKLYINLTIYITPNFSLRT